MNQQTIGIIGGGNMGAAILKGIHRQFATAVCEQDKLKCRSLKAKFKTRVLGLEGLLKESGIVILAVKPQDFEVLLDEIKTRDIRNRLFISIAAGITTSYIEKKLGAGVRVIRAMPNLPAMVGEGMTALCSGRAAKTADVKKAVKIFDCVGRTVVIEEKWMDAVTSVSGSGPAYVFLFVECLLKAAQSLGLNERNSNQLIYQTLKGSLALLDQQKEEPGILRARVTSKGGTTQAATDIFMRYGLEKIFIEALTAARDRAKELAK